MGYSSKKDNPTEFWIKAQMNDIEAEVSTVSISVEPDIESYEEKVILQKEDGGSLELYIDPDEEDSFIVIEYDEEDLHVSLDELACLEFDVRPSDDQCRIITTGEYNIDFGI